MFDPIPIRNCCDLLGQRPGHLSIHLVCTESQPSLAKALGNPGHKPPVRFGFLVKWWWLSWMVYEIVFTIVYLHILSYICFLNHRLHATKIELDDAWWSFVVTLGDVDLPLPWEVGTWFEHVQIELFQNIFKKTWGYRTRFNTQWQTMRVGNLKTCRRRSQPFSVTSWLKKALDNPSRFRMLSCRKLIVCYSLLLKLPIEIVDLPKKKMVMFQFANW